MLIDLYIYKFCIPSLSPQLGIWGNVTGFEGHSGVDVCQGSEPDTGESQYSSICMYVAPPVRMGAWSMACVLQR